MWPLSNLLGLLVCHPVYPFVTLLFKAFLRLLTAFLTQEKVQGYSYDFRVFEGNLGIASSCIPCFEFDAFDSPHMWSPWGLVHSLSELRSSLPYCLSKVFLLGGLLPFHLFKPSSMLHCYAPRVDSAVDSFLLTATVLFVHLRELCVPQSKEPCFYFLCTSGLMMQR